MVKSIKAISKEIMARVKINTTINKYAMLFFIVSGIIMTLVINGIFFGLIFH